MGWEVDTCWGCDDEEEPASTTLPYPPAPAVPYTGVDALVGTLPDTVPPDGQPMAAAGTGWVFVAFLLGAVFATVTVKGRNALRGMRRGWRGVSSGR